MKAMSLPNRKTLLSQAALGFALAIAAVPASMMLATPAEAAKKPSFKFSAPFQAAAGPLQTAVNDAPKRPEVIAATAKVTAADQALQQARGKTQREQAQAAFNAAVAELGGTMTNEKALLETAFAAIGNEDDRYMFGNLAQNLGTIAMDTGMRRRGLQAMLQSGKVEPATVPTFNYYVGQFSYLMNDYPTAIQSLQAAVDAGFTDKNAEIILAESLNSSGQTPQALAVLRKAVDRVAASGSKAPEAWYSRGYRMAYKAKLNDAVNEWAADAVRNYPTPFNWLGAFQLAYETNVSAYTTHEDLDIGRLEKLSGALTYEPATQAREYQRFIQAAEARRMWPEVVSWSQEAVRAGAFQASDPFIAEKQGMARTGLAADARDVAGMVRDAATSANGLTALGAGDASLSAGDFAKAEEFYKIALTKGNADRDRVLTRLGIAQIQLGKYADAKASFQQVTGPRAALARLGAILADVKAAPPAPAAAPAPAGAQR